MYDDKENTGKEYTSQEELGGNLVQESNVVAEGETFPQEQIQYTSTDMRQTKGDNSFHMDKYFENFHENPKFSEKEREFSQKVDNFIKSKTGKSISAFPQYIFLVNKILMLTTFLEFLFQRFDIVTLFLNIVIILIEIGVFSHKWIYIHSCAISNNKTSICRIFNINYCCNIANRRSNNSHTRFNNQGRFIKIKTFC